ncbi:hypothetical protein HanPI659440_Chr06g0252001 [Helianthus annuus]|nr:hypothetical protein HanPI659440_Chr06g0252001 [Helianthus annuus]
MLVVVAGEWRWRLSENRNGGDLDLCVFILVTANSFDLILLLFAVMMMFDDVLEDTDLSLVSFYKSVFDFLEDDVLDLLDFLGFDDDV